MVQPATVSVIEHREECQPYKQIDENEKAFLPIFAAPMSTVVNEDNYEIFQNNRIIPILPRNKHILLRLQYAANGYWVAFSLMEFKENFIINPIFTENKPKVLIDIANGHMKQLYSLVSIAKKIYSKHGGITIMVGNIANPETYREAYLTGVDYIRCGIGSGSQCITSSNVAIHYPMASLIYDTYLIKQSLVQQAINENKKLPLIVADGGIRNYSDVIKSLALGADFCMIGGLFASLKESAAETFKTAKGEFKIIYGMASAEGQKDIYGKKIKTAEGIKKNIPVLTTLSKWSQNMSDYMRSAMSYTGIKNIKNFGPENVTCHIISEEAKKSINQ